MADVKPLILDGGTIKQIATGDTLGVANGGTGATTLTDNGVLIGNGTGAIVATAVGTAGEVLTSNGAGSDPTFQAAAGGVTGFTASLNTSSPNNTVNASMILASGGSTNQDAVISPKGTGAFQLNLADSTTTGGNKRGTNAIDLQTIRSANTGVASGQGSVVVGVYNISSGTNSVAIGGFCTASGTYSVAIGQSNSATTTNAVALGYRSTASMYGQLAMAAGYFSAAKDAQVSRLIARKQTTNNTQTELYLDGSTLRISIASGAAYAFEVRVFGSRTDAGVEVFHSKIEGTIVNAGGTTALEGTNTTTVITDTSAGAWAAVVEADNTNDALVIKVTGATSKTIRWVASIELIETTT